MSYIEREKALKVVDDIMSDCKVSHKHRALNRNIKQIPTADVVEVVRCRDCKHFVFDKNRAMCGRRATFEYGEWLGLTATDFDHYCSYGERRADDGT